MRFRKTNVFCRVTGALMRGPPCGAVRMARVEGGRGGSWEETERVRVRGVVRGGKRRERKMERRKRRAGERGRCMIGGDGMDGVGEVVSGGCRSE